MAITELESIQKALENPELEFPAGAYFDTTLPDTDSRSYAVRIYSNPDVDRKGKTNAETHWRYGTGNGKEKLSGDYVFHVRADSPQEGVHRIQEIQSDIQNELSYDRTSAKMLYERKKASGEELDFELEPSQYTLDVPYIKQGLQEEIVLAAQSGQREVWLTVNPDEIGTLQRDKGPQKNYEQGGQIHNTFKSLAKRFDATVKEEDGYLKLVFPTTKPNNAGKYVVGASGASVLSIPAYAESNGQDFRSAAFAEGFRPGEINQYLAEKPIPEDEQPLWVEQALNEGFTQEEITQYQFEEFIKEVDPTAFAEPDEENLPIKDEDLPLLDGETYQYDRLTADQVKSLAVELQVNPLSPSGINAIYRENLRRAEPGTYDAVYGRSQEQVEQDMADIVEIYDVDRPYLWAKSKLGDAQATATYEALKARDRESVITLASEVGYDAFYGTGPTDTGGNGGLVDELYVMINGEPVHAEPGLLASLARHSGEIAGGIAGVQAGVQQAAKLGSVIDGPLAGAGAVGKLVGQLAKFGVITAYTAAGAVLGDQVDYMSAAARQEADMTWSMAAEKAMGATQASVVADTLGVPVAYVGKFVWQRAMHAFNEVKDGNLDAAFNTLKDVTGLDDDQITAIVERWKLLNTPDAVDQPLTIERSSPIPFTGGTKQQTLSPKEEALAIVPSTKAGGENLVAAASSVNQRASILTARQVNKRAQDLIAESTARVDKAVGS